jgi:hypothetical protein
LDFCSETELLNEVKELLFDDANLPKVVDDKKSWFMQIEVCDLMSHQYFLPANSIGCHPTTWQYFQSRTAQTLALAAAAIHCAPSEYASGRMSAIMFSHDIYRGTFYPSSVMNITSEPTALINGTFVCCLIPTCGAPLQG